MAKVQYVAKNRIVGISFNEKTKENSVHEAGAVIELDENDPKTKELVTLGALAEK